MKINANEMLLINRNLKLKGDEGENTTSSVALADAPESEANMNALNALSTNNIAFQGASASLRKMGFASIAALSLLAGATSCTDWNEPLDPPVINVNVTTNLQVNIYMTDDELVAAVIQEQQRLRELLEQMHKDQQANHEEQMEINRKILEALLNQGISLDRIIALLEQMNMTAEDIFNLLIENSDKQDQILDEITNGNKEFKAILNNILNSINHGNSLTEANNKLLTMILVQMNQANQNDKAMMELLGKILAKVEESIQSGKDIAKEQQELLGAILSSLQSLDEDMKQGILAILNKIDKVSKANITLLAKILQAVNEGNKNDAKALEILNAIYNKVQESIDTNKDIAAEQQQLMEAILASLSSLDNDMKQGILAILGKIDKVSKANINLLVSILKAVNESNQNDKAALDILNAIYNKVQESIDSNKEIAQQTQTLLTIILNKLSAMDNHMKQGIMAIISHIDKASDANIKLLIKLIEKVDNLESSDSSSTEILNKILDKIQESIDSNKEMNAKTYALLQSILDNIQNFNADLKSAVESILAKLDSMSEDNKTLLGDILNNIQNMNEDLKRGFAAIIKNLDKMSAQDRAFYQKILAKLDKMSEENKTLLGSILENIQNLNADLKTGFESVIENMDNMSAENRAFYQQILAKLDKLDSNSQRAFGMLLQEMVKNNKITSAMLKKIDNILEKLEKSNQADRKFYNQALALLAELVSKVDQLGSKADAILDAIANISIDANVDLSTIEKMLSDLLAQSKANGDVLTSIEGKMNLLAITLEGIKSELENMSGDHKAILDKLDEILNKIPDKCNCDASLQVIIQKLEKIIEEIKNGNSHEGVLDDLEDWFQ